MTCVRCGSALKSTDAYCSFCGQAVAASRAPGDPTLVIPPFVQPPPSPPSPQPIPLTTPPRKRSVSAVRLAVIVFFGLLGLMFVLRMRHWALSLVPSDPDTQKEGSRSGRAVSGTTTVVVVDGRVHTLALPLDTQHPIPDTPSLTASARSGRSRPDSSC